jgi:hypothetical protein
MLPLLQLLLDTLLDTYVKYLTTTISERNDTSTSLDKEGVKSSLRAIIFANSLSSTLIFMNSLYKKYKLYLTNYENLNCFKLQDSFVACSSRRRRSHPTKQSPWRQG